MKQYDDLLEYALQGNIMYEDPNRQGILRYMVPNVQFLTTVSKRDFPILTRKRIFFKGVVGELLWILKGLDYIDYLIDNGINIWNKDVYNFYKRTNPSVRNITYEDWLESKTGAKTYSGRAYPVQLRQFGNDGLDQLYECIRLLKKDHYNSANVVTYWDADDVSNGTMALKPCHYSWQVQGVPDNKVNMTVNMRSTDIFLGLPFNISSYALLLILLCEVTGKIPGDLAINMANAHLYSNHVDAAEEYLSSTGTVLLPSIEIPEFDHTQHTSRAVAYLENLEIEDIKLINYESGPYIKAEMIPYDE